MQAIAKKDWGYKIYTYSNWRQGKRYPCKISRKGNRIDIVDEKGIVFHFTGNAEKNLSDIFEFIKS